MKITALEVEGYGIWSGLKLDGLSDGLNVFYGPNEAGKTTLMQFLRSVFYGFSPERRRYLPPLRGGRPGGSVHVTGPNGRFQISRYDNEELSGGPDRLALTAPDGTRQGEHFLKVLLYDVDEAIFNNVFAVGLRELQELATLSDTEAASLLYNLSIGLDRVSLVEVMRELDASRNRLVDARGGPCQVAQLLAQRERLQAEIEESASLSRRYARLAAEQELVDREIGRLEEESGEIEKRLRVAELALALGDRWRRRAALVAELAVLEPAGSLQAGLVEKLDTARDRLQSRQQRLDAWRQRQAQLRREASALEVNEALWRLAPRIEGLQEQEGWIDTLSTRIDELELETLDLEGRLDQQRKRFGLAAGAGVSLPTVLPQTLAALRGPGRAVRASRARLQQAEREEAASRQTARSLGDEIQAALDARGEAQLPDAVDRSGSLVAQLRRRAQIDERIEKMEGYRAELERRTRDLLARQLMPIWVVLALGALFVVGVVLALAGLFMPESITGKLGWPMSILGLLGTCTAVVTRIVVERSNARQLDACQTQTNMLHAQIKHAKEEREQLDRQLPGVKGAVHGRLKAAENELAGLEQLVPLDSQRQAAEQEAEASAQRAAQARAELEAARRRWRDALAASGLPKDLSPKQFGQLAAGSEQIAELQRSLALRREELQQRRRELAGLTARIAQLVADCRLELPGDKPVEQLRELVRQVGEQAARLKRRDLLRRQLRQMRRRRIKLEAHVTRWKRRRRELLCSAGVESEQELRHRARTYERTASLRRELETLQQEISAAIAGKCSEESLRSYVEGPAADDAASRSASLQKRLQAAQAQLRERFEKRGRLSEQVKHLAQDRAPIVRQAELSVVEQRLGEAVRRWQVLAVTSRILDGIRATYERHRQPETLQEASVHLERLTQGRYGRVWTPFGQQILLVDDAAGKSLPVEALSQGGREQLFLGLRLALASSYARRGASLPMVLDDVLVNFDEQRAKAAAGVLRDFAEAGHQLLVFTCHEHLARLFKSLRIDVRVLPGQGASEVLLDPPAPAPRRARRRRPERFAHPVVAPSPDEEPSPKESPEERPPLDDDSDLLEHQALWEEGEVEDAGSLLEHDAERADAEDDASDEEDEYDRPGRARAGGAEAA